MQKDLSVKRETYTATKSQVSYVNSRAHSKKAKLTESHRLEIVKYNSCLPAVWPVRMFRYHMYWLGFRSFYRANGFRKQ